MSRAESGPLRFGDDWAGVFLRGDYAGPMAMYLTQFLQTGRLGPIERACLAGLADTLAGSDERGSLDGLQQLPDFALCKALTERIAAIEAMRAEEEAASEKARAEWDFFAATGAADRAETIAKVLRILRGEA